mgnify:CR=1 FL=1
MSVRVLFREALVTGTTLEVLVQQHLDYLIITATTGGIVVEITTRNLIF